MTQHGLDGLILYPIAEGPPPVKTLRLVPIAGDSGSSSIITDPRPALSGGGAK